MNDRSPVRIGILGAAAVVPMALTGPARSVPDDAIANMRVIDAIYEKAGLKRRGTWRGSPNGGEN